MLHRWVLFCLVIVVLPGCMHRRVTVYSDPPGALAKVDGKSIGYTPASFDYTWYGTREIQVLKDGYETDTRLVTFDPPWYQRFPLDLVSDNFAGRRVDDHRQIRIPLRKVTRDSSHDVLERGRSLRSEASHGVR